MRAVILNSGTGSRMGSLTEGRPKCLVPLNDGDTILSRQIRMLQDAGVSDILITIGPYENMIPDYLEKEFPGLKVNYVRNELYDKTNYIYSMYLADEFLREHILLLHGDIVLEPKVLHQILKAKGSQVVVDSTVPLPDKDFKGRLSAGRIIEIGTTIEKGRDVVFLLPVYVLTRSFMERWMDAIAEFVHREDTSVYAENAFNQISSDLALEPLDIKGAFCMEVDTLEDLAVAREEIR